MQSGCVGGRRPSAPGSWCAPVRPAALERPPAPAQPPPWAPQLPPWGAPQLPPWVAPQLPPWVAPQLPPWLEKSQEAAPLQRGHRAPQLPPWAAKPPSNSTTLRCEAELLFHRQSGLLREQMLRKRRMEIQHQPRLKNCLSPPSCRPPRASLPTVCASLLMYPPSCFPQPPLATWRSVLFSALFDSQQRRAVCGPQA